MAKISLLCWIRVPMWRAVFCKPLQQFVSENLQLSESPELQTIEAKEIEHHSSSLFLSFTQEEWQPTQLSVFMNLGLYLVACRLQVRDRVGTTSDCAVGVTVQRSTCSRSSLVWMAGYEVLNCNHMIY